MANLLESRAGAANLGVPLMITSFLVVAGFMYWLSVTAKPTEIIPPVPLDELVNVVTLAEFSAGPDEYIGDTISMESLSIGSRFGNHGHWISLVDANRNGYLLHVSDSLRADTAAVSSLREGMIADLTGMVVPTTDSVLDAWEAAGAFGQEIDKVLAGSTPYLNFIEVIRIEEPAVPPPGQGDGSGSG